MLSSDLRYALRTLLRAPGFTAAVVLTLGLGIGANTAIFSVIRGVLLKPLPHREGDRLVYLRHSISGPGGESILFSVPEITDFREEARSFAGIAEYSSMIYTLEGERDAVRMNVGLVTGNYFDVMGLSPGLGRLLDESDDGTAVPPVMVLTHEYWVKRFAADPGVVGREVRLRSKAVRIVGVVEPAPYFPTRMDALLNMVMSEHHTSIPFKQGLGERARLTLALLMGAAAFVMIISCANVANLTLMRSVRREHELVVRAALGAGASRLRMLLLVENLVLALMGAALGVVLAVAGVQMLTSLAERYSPRASEIRLDGVVLAFTLLLAVWRAYSTHTRRAWSGTGSWRRG